ncbi:bifunctional folylpolyglutamate synthase/dihydrofolate synthase [Allorhodopirellula heiligendammensis]|nr:folylpolyglutamate synthase/dihydrofolate synthase family protein [Allorhodopirellula heiligendammensis]
MIPTDGEEKLDKESPIATAAASKRFAILFQWRTDGAGGNSRRHATMQTWLLVSALALITLATFSYIMPPSKLAARDAAVRDSAADDPTTDPGAAYHAATRWLYDRIDYERLARSGSRYRFTLDRMRDLVTRLGHGRYLYEAAGGRAEPPPVAVSPSGRPPKAKLVHVAGTKGKGSVATMTAHMLATAGFRVGLYTSPHLVDLEERFRVNGLPATRLQMIALVNSMRPIVQEMSRDRIGGPSFFELTTAIAIEHFHRCECDYWVLETGLGGRLDSTNVFQSDVTLITSIGLDHQNVLGDTLELIAKEKAGILKPGVPAISGVTKSPAREVIRQTAAEVGAPLLELGQDFDVRDCTSASFALTDVGEAPAWGSSFELLGEDMNATSNLPVKSVHLSLEGRHQIGNAAVALMGLKRLGVSLDAAVLDALGQLQIEARLERFVLPAGETAILDAAHNPDSITALVETLQARFAGRRLIGVFGTSVDKDAATMLDLLRPCLSAVVLTQYHGNPRFVPVQTLAGLAAATVAGSSASPGPFISPATAWYVMEDDPVVACQTARELAGRDGIVVVCGSFFLAAEVRPWLVTQVT